MKPWVLKLKPRDNIITLIATRLADPLMDGFLGSSLSHAPFMEGSNAHGFSVKSLSSPSTKASDGAIRVHQVTHPFVDRTESGLWEGANTC